MKNILIANYNIPINKLINEIKNGYLAIKLDLKKHVKEMNTFVESMIELKEKNPEKSFLVIDDGLKEIYCSKNKDHIYFKFNKSFYEDTETTTKIIIVYNDGSYLALIEDKKNKKIFVVNNRSTGAFQIYFYESNSLKRYLSVFFKANEHELLEMDINSLGYISRVIKSSSKGLLFQSKNSYVEYIDKNIYEKNHYEITFNKEKSDLENMTLVNGKVKDFRLTEEAFKKLPKQIKDKIYKEKQIYKNDCKVFEEAAKYLKEKSEMEFLSEDKPQNIDIECLLNNIKNTINDKQDCFYNYNKNHSHLLEVINIITENITGEQLYLKNSGYQQSKQLEYKGISLIECEGYDYKKTDYENFNFENINHIYNFISNELEISGHDGNDSVE